MINALKDLVKLNQTLQYQTLHAKHVDQIVILKKIAIQLELVNVMRAKLVMHLILQQIYVLHAIL